MTKRKSRTRKFVESQARKMFDKLSPKEKGFHPFPKEFRSFCDHAFPVVLKNSGWMSPELLGKISSGGRSFRTETGETDLYRVHCGTWVGKYDSGREILQRLAATTLVAAMWDLLMEDGDIELESA